MDGGRNPWLRLLVMHVTLLGDTDLTSHSYSLKITVKLQFASHGGPKFVPWIVTSVPPRAVPFVGSKR
jgi:hypothetical protein